MNSRRTFLQSAALAAWTPAPGDSQGQNAAPLLPTVKLAKHDITRPIVGSNPFYG